MFTEISGQQLLERSFCVGERMETSVIRLLGLTLTFYSGPL